MVQGLGARVAVSISAVLLFVLAPAGGHVSLTRASSATSQAVCIGHHPQDFVWYTSSCTGHDEPEIDPLSNKAGSAKDLTWTIVLPSNGSVQVDSVGPTFWTGGTVTDPRSLSGQAFLEVQFYPNSLVKGCTSGGGYNVDHVEGVYTVCSPVWAVAPKGFREYAEFNAMLTDSASPGSPLVMHQGDTVTIHQYVTAAQDGMHITITDLTSSHSGTIILNSSQAGPLMPAFDVQKLGNALGWGLVDDAPNSFVWEIGHTSSFTQPASQFCLPGSATKPPCYSYDVPTWLGFTPLQIKSVTFGSGSTSSTANSFAVVSDYGGKAEVDQYCGAANYGTPFCWYPWYAYNGNLNAFTYGGDYTGTQKDYGQALQFDQNLDCPSPSGPNTTYCSTVLH